MSNKQFNARMQQKIDTYENWSKATNFIPLKGELIIYTTDENGNEKIGFKVGTGEPDKNVHQLDFISLGEAAAAVDEIASNLANNYYTSTKIDEKVNSLNNNIKETLLTKADLVNGKVPLAQLPVDIGNGTLVQEQVDYNQNDNTKVDFIKNRPFYDTRIFSHFNSDETPNPVN